MELGTETLDAFPDAVSAELVAMSDRKQMDRRLRELGITKLGRRAAVINAILIRQQASKVATPPLPDGSDDDGPELGVNAGEPVSQQSAQCVVEGLQLSSRLRVLFVAHSGYFAGNTYGGATRASLAMLRDVLRFCGDGLEIMCLSQRPMPEGMVYKLTEGALGVYEWEGLPVLIGREDDLRAALAGRRYHAVVSLSIEASLLSLAASVGGVRHYAMAHNYYLPPFGPFRRFAVQPGHLEQLQALDSLLCPCEHHCAFLRRWAPMPVHCQPLYAADYQYFHNVRPDGSLALPEPMEPWEPSHRYVTLVSPCPEKGLAILLALARLMPDTPFAAVPTQWTDGASRARLEAVHNITVLEPNPDVDVIFRQTRVLLAPSVWQECCPLIVMEAVVRGIPCVSSDWGGLPEANPNPRLLVRARLSYDHARGVLHHGLTNDELESKLGAALPAADEAPGASTRAAAAKEAVDEEATPFEARPFAEALRPLLTDMAVLKRESAAVRASFVTFATERHGALERLLRPLASTELDDSTPAAPAGGEDGATGGVRALATRAGFKLVELLESDLRRTTTVDEVPGAIPIDPPATYRVVHRPMIVLRAAPSRDAEIVGMAPAGMEIQMGAQRNGWVRTAAAVATSGRRAWALVDGAALGLGQLLERVS